MKNIRVEVVRDNYITVTADTERFGDDAIMYEGSTFRACFDYIKRETGAETLMISGSFPIWYDLNGEAFPLHMTIEPKGDMK